MSIYLSVLSSVILPFVFSAILSAQQAYELVPYLGDLKVERFDTTSTDENWFNHNNRIYTVGSSFTYQYDYFTKDGKPQNFAYSADDWQFIEPKSNEVQTVTMKIRSGRKPLSDWIPDYNQTVISYHLYNNTYFEMTGLIENEANIWLHPPRDGLYKILELNPFPSISYPLEIDRSWEWSLPVGSVYSDKRWAIWEGVIENKMTYKMTERKIKETIWGSLEIWIIEAEASNVIGKTSLKASFNDSLGFIEMNFVNIDGSSLAFKLVEVTK